MKKLSISLLVLLFAILPMIGCDNSNDDFRIEKEKKICNQFLLGIKDNDIEKSISYLGKSILDESSKDDIKHMFQEMRDTFGNIEKYELIKWNEIKEQRGDLNLYDREYIFHVEYSKGFKLLLNFTFHLGKDEDNKIDIFSVDEYE